MSAPELRNTLAEDFLIGIESDTLKESKPSISFYVKKKETI